MNDKSSPLEIVILMPVFNDWGSVKVLLQRIDDCLRHSDFQFKVLIIDDGSSLALPDNFIEASFSSLLEIDILALRRNLGHQRAIAVGLTYILNSCPCDAIIVMDADGEDRPEDIVPLLNLCSKNRFENIVFAERAKRVERLSFKFFYRCYQILHRMLTGHSVRVGNFSVIPFDFLSPLVVSSELWNHYAASVHKLKLPFKLLPTSRDRRIFGQSKMNFTSLVIHGLSAISVYSDQVGTRVLFAACGINLFLFSVFIIILSIRFFTDLSIPGWATYSSGIILIIFLQILATAASFLFFILNGRNSGAFLPLRDYSFFIQETTRIFTRYE